MEDEKSPRFSQQQVLSILKEAFANGMAKLSKPGRKIYGLMGSADLVTREGRTSFVKAVELVSKSLSQTKQRGRNVPFEVSTGLSMRKITIRIKAKVWGRGFLAYEDERDFNEGVNDVFRKHGIKGFWVDDRWFD